MGRSQWQWGHTGINKVGLEGQKSKKEQGRGYYCSTTGVHEESTV